MGIEGGSPNLSEEDMKMPIENDSKGAVIENFQLNIEETKDRVMGWLEEKENELLESLVKISEFADGALEKIGRYSINDNITGAILAGTGSVLLANPNAFENYSHIENAGLWVGTIFLSLGASLMINNKMKKG